MSHTGDVAGGSYTSSGRILKLSLPSPPKKKLDWLVGAVIKANSTPVTELRVQCVTFSQRILQCFVIIVLLDGRGVLLSHLAMARETKTWSRDGGGITLRTAFKNLSMILVIISLLMSASSARETNANVSGTSRKPTVRSPVVPLKIGMPEFNNYNADRITVSWSNHSLYSEQKAHYQFKASGPGVYSNCKICLKKRSFDRWGFFGFGYGRHGDDGCRSDCGECQSSDTSANCYLKAQVNSSYSIEVKLWANGSSDSSSHDYVSVAKKSVTTKEYVWPFVTRNVFQRLTQEELNQYSRYKEYPIKCIQSEFHSFKKITKYQILIRDRPQSSSTAGNYKIGQIDKNGNIFKGTVVHDNTSLPDMFVFGKDESGRKFALSPASRYYFIFRVFIDENFLDTRTFYFDTERNTVKDALVAFFVTILVSATLGIIGYQAYHRHFSPILKRGQSMELPLLLPERVDNFGAKPVKLAVLFEEIDRRLANDKKELQKEFNQLEILSPVKTCEIAKDAVNTEKNRYNNILPFDETRVILDEYRDFEGSNYINASYVHGYNKPKEFIATQGPRGRDRDSFWRMVWEKNVQTIVMVTNCIEAKQKKCCRYWPDTSDPDKTILLPKVGMKIAREDVRSRERDGYVMRVMRVSKDSLILTTSRLVTQFHFSEWSDMGCPNKPDNLISLAKAVKERSNPSCPTIVHCSAGVGRTGTFIGLCNLMEEMKVKDSVDIYQAVYRMRQNRMNMVQTLAQYEFLYKCARRVYEQMRRENLHSQI